MTTFTKGETGEELTVEGLVEFHEVAERSHSAHRAPALRDDQGALYRLALVGDNPFEQSTLSELVGCRLRVHGRWKNGTLRLQPDGFELLAAPNEVP
ncbi:MAG: hypothetical protein CO108_28260 [Deltaproteobacteria bacterium CG_4_9_14_3_um_filter_63_12]|nr:MAG: hypothetical protein CO108_28260 [Deltaproteobacteria bacterium CG_4_9_14_3_um_filter_63_12]